MPYSRNMDEAHRVMGLALRTEREVKGLTLKALARCIPMNPGTLGALERGKTRLTLDHLIAICAVLDVNPVDVLSNMMRLTTKKPHCTCSAVPRETST